VLSIDSPVAISCLSLDELGYFDENKEEHKNQEVHDEGNRKDSSRNSGE
jgi:hypothetical protein